MFKNKSLIAFTIIFILLSSMFALGEVEMPQPTKAFYSADYAGILTEEVEQIIVGTNLNYEKTEEKPQIVVATVPNIQGMDVVDYGVKLFEQWEIGNKEYDNGVLILLSTEERKIRIEVGYGLEGAIPDGKTGEILDSIVPDLSEGNYSKGLLKAFYQVAKEVNVEYGYDDESIFSNFQNVDIDYTNTSSSKTNDPVLTIKKVILALIILILIWFDNRFLGGFFMGMIFRMMLFGRGRGGFGGGGGSFGGGGGSGGGGADRDF